ncbi:MAG: hypothetical protein ACTTIC_07595 [Helicobacteraceae bacterium]
MKNLLVLTDAGSGVGMGHLSRTRAIADEFENAELVVAQGGVGSWHESLPQNTGFDAVLVDSYRVGDGAIKALKGSFACVCVVSDFGGAVREADLTINPNLYGTVGQKTVGGRDYIPLRKELVRAKKTKLIKQETLLIALGSAAPNGLALELAKAQSGDFKSVICIGAGADFDNVSFRQDLLPVEMARVLAQADLAVTAGGVTMNELAFFGVPFVAIKTADNQDLALQEFKRRGIINGHFGGADEICRELSRLKDLELMKDLSLKEQALIGINGAKNIKTAILAC